MKIRTKIVLIISKAINRNVVKPKFSNAEQQVPKHFKPKSCYFKKEIISLQTLYGPETTLPNNNQAICRIEKMTDRNLEELMKDFILTESQTQEIYKRFGASIRKGLAKKTHNQSDIKCFPTFVHNLPTGEERGKILALDLGGTNFRVLLVTLNGPKDAEVQSTIYEIPKSIMIGPGTELFDHIVDCIAVFVKERSLENETLPLGFTFSFPCEQLSIASARLVRWTKGFKSAGVVNEDIGRLFNEALARRGNMKVQLKAIVNDTTGTLMSCAHRNELCRIGFIVGTGCNACFVEQVDNVEILPPEAKKQHDYVLINTECGGFGDNGGLDFIRTESDRIIDEASLNCGGQMYEKMISGMYLGELVRLTLVKAMELKLIFKCVHKRDELSKTLNTPNSFPTKYISGIEEDCLPELQITKGILKDGFHIEKADMEDCEKLKYICECISRRGAILAGIGLSALVNKLNMPKVIIGVDGTLIRKHPHFKNNMREIMLQLVDVKTYFELMESVDGSGLGAALVAAVASSK